MSSNKIKTYYVYELLNPLKDNEPFYVGKGTNHRNRYERITTHITESKKHCGHNRFKQNVIRKILREGYTVQHKIVFETSVQEDAWDKERELITYYGRRDLGTGPLTNLTERGERYTVSEETKQKLRGRPSWNLGIPMSDETKIKLSIIKMEYYKTPEGKATVIDSRLKVSKPIYQICLDTGIIINKFESIQAAARTFNISSKDIQQSLTSHTVTHTAHGFYWRHISDVIIVDRKISNLDEINFKRLKNKKVQQYSKEKELIKIWDNVHEISAFYNISRDNIYGALCKQGSSHGFYWKYVGDDRPFGNR